MSVRAGSGVDPRAESQQEAADSVAESGVRREQTRAVARVRVARVSGASWDYVADSIVVEEPMSVRVSQRGMVFDVLVRQD